MNTTLLEAIQNTPDYTAMIDNIAIVTISECEGDEVYKGDATLTIRQADVHIELWCRVDTIRALYAALGQHLREYYDLES